MKRVLGIIYVIGGICLLTAVVGCAANQYIIESILFAIILFVWWIGLGPVEKKVNS